jgi:uncharacterized membrane protein YgcG
MKRLVLVLLGILAIAPRAPAQDCATPGPDSGWTIRSFVSDYGVLENGEVDVVERIEVDFGKLSRHGIYRVIPVEYRRLVRPDLPIPAGTVDVGIDVDRVVDGTGEPYEVQVSREGPRTRIRVGSPDFCVTGPVTYVLHYRLEKGAIAFFDELDELYWQVTGTEWPVPIERVEASVRLPSDRALARADSAPWQAHCYAGTAESTSDADCTAEILSPGFFRFAARRTLQPGEGLTLAAGFPKGIVPGPTPATRAADMLFRYGPLAIPLIVLVLLAWIWGRYGREPAMGSIAPQWRPPDGLRPGPAGALVDQRADVDDVVATVLDLAVRGHLQIREVPPKFFDRDSIAGKLLGSVGLDRRDWELVRLGQDAGELEPFEKEVLRALFDGQAERRLSDLKHEFYKDLSKIKEKIYDDLVRRRLFPRSPAATRTRWVVMGILVLVAGFGLGFLALGAGYWAVLPALVISGILVIAFSFSMPKMSAEGARVRRHVEGLEEYIRRAEKAEIEFKDAPQKTPELFSALLPYAIALDVSDIWVRQFEGLLTSPPAWYVGTWSGTGSSSGWNLAGFSDGLSDFKSSASSTLQSAPGSSGSGSGGGGSVGGGGGGGGGGSW